ncbi:MAG: HAMP domain-containing histidine kinase [Muribaculaceae bacterium]|nr:HAMP domain-containing histidine kinase [Muribaculaceae bacterium]
MEKRIKALYIITIIAIMAFLGMQFYWLRSRYEYSLREYERALCDRIERCVDEYSEIRNSSSKQDVEDRQNKGDDEISIPTFSLSQQYGDSVKTSRTAKIMTYRYSAHELLGLKPGTPLSDEQRDRVIDMVQNRMDNPVDSSVYDASGARDENEAWIASKNVQTERKNPFTAAGIDSILAKAGIRSMINLDKSDTTVWKIKKDYNTSLFSPSVSLTIPYSQLEGRTATIVSHVNPFDVLPGMWQTLTITLIVSFLLIVCLILQFTTVLKLSRLDKLRNSFITTMIHELKRPISTLKMCISGLGNDRLTENGAIKKELLSETRNALDNLAAYFSKLRDITFNDVEQIPLNIQSINLHELFDTVDAATLRPSGKEVLIINKITADINVSVDRSHFYNILINLVENSIKYSGPEVKINAEGFETDGFVELKIRDNGNGIPSADLKHIFSRFYRGKASAGEQPGMGLGLAYVKLLVEAHGGEINVESSEGNGTCFTITLPQ